MEHILALIPKLPRFIILLIFLIAAVLLDGLAYGFFNSCPACTSFTQFLRMPISVSASIIASISSLFTLTTKQK